MLLPHGEFKLFDQADPAAGKPGDAAWYKDRAVSDHINEPGHRTRLLTAKDLVMALVHHTHDGTVSDWGAGNGGMLAELKKMEIEAWGYDMSPLAVEWGRTRYDVDLTCLDVTRWNERRKAGEIVLCTEFLEHLEDPHDLVKQLYCIDHVQYVVASVPGFEDPGKPYEFHLWSWHGSSFAEMFERIGWKVQRHFFMPSCGTQFLVAGR